MGNFPETFASIIVCTYNPPKKRLENVLKSILKQEIFSCEIIVIDNNSTNTEPENVVKKLNAEYNDSIILIKEKKQGLAFARLCGVKSSKGDWIVFVDDDNLIDENYIKNLKEIQSKIADCDCWGPGTINVTLEGPVDSFIKKYCKSYFQQRQIKGSPHDKSKKWKEFYPTGSGMCVKRNSFLSYAKKFEDGKINLTGRKLTELSSGEDAQIIFSCIQDGKKVGASENLKLNHIINFERCNLTYLKKLNYSVSRDFYLTKFEIFNDTKIFEEQPGFKLKVKLFLK